MSHYGGYNSRRNSNSFSEEQNGAVRKKGRWANKKRGGGGGGAVFRSPADKPRPSNSSSYRENSFRSPMARSSSTQQYFNIRDMPEFIEPQHAGAPWQWENYLSECKAWQDKHKLAYYRSRCLALEFENKMLFEQIEALIGENSELAAEHGELPSMRLPDIGGKQERHTKPGAPTSNTQTTPKRQGKNRKTDSSSELDFEIDEDMMAFLEKSIRHKLSLNKKRKADGEKVKTEEGDKSKEKQGPKQSAGAKRQGELDQLYGKKATMIQGLETSLQLNFNRVCDIHKPELYPTVALNVETAVNA